MAEPSVTLMPGAYDDNTTLIGDQIDQRTFVLDGAINDTVTDITVLGSLGDLEVPCYILFTDSTNEMVFVESKAGSILTVIREVRGTTKAAHANGASASLILSGQQVNMFREAVIAGQKFQGLVGLESAKPATPVVNQVYFETDTKKLFVCVTAGVWQWAGNRDDHADLLDLDTEDDHDSGTYAYHNDARALEWHDALGTGTTGHVQGGDTHDHGYATAFGAGRVQAGVASGRSSTPTYEREVYYETDTEFLYISKGSASSADWVKIVGAPVGTIVPFRETDITTEYSGACPPGWTRYTALDDKLAKGAPTGVTSPLNSGGVETHTHDYSDVPQHSHSILGKPVSLLTTGTHSHNIKEQGASSGTAIGNSGGQTCVDNASSTDAVGTHTHSFTVTAHTTATTKRTSDEAASVSGGTTETGSNWPEYQELIWCKKT